MNWFNVGGTQEVKAWLGGFRVPTMTLNTDKRLVVGAVGVAAAVLLVGLIQHMGWLSGAREAQAGSATLAASANSEPAASVHADVQRVRADDPNIQHSERVLLNENTAVPSPENTQTRPAIASEQPATTTVEQVKGIVITQTRPIDKININTADLSALTTLRGIGATKASEILAYRTAHGLFYVTEDIMLVSGIGQTTFESIKNDITVGDVGPRPVQKVSPPEEPAPPQTPTDPPAPAPTAAKSTMTSKVNINTDDAAALATLSGIGPSKAQAIISDRQTNGPFYAVEDIVRVSGIGQATFDNIKDDITVGDVGPRPTPTPPPSQEPPPQPENDKTPAPSIPNMGSILISIIMPGIQGDAANEYVELKNLGAHPIDLAGWNVKKATSGGTVSTLVSSKYFEGKTMPAGGTLLLANGGGYTGTASADVLWPASYSIAASHNSLQLVDSGGTTVDTAAWEEIPDGSQCARSAINTPCEMLAGVQ